MSHIEVQTKDYVSVVTIDRGKVNALNEELIDQLSWHMEKLEKDEKVHAVVLTGVGKFFSFGFDVPELRSLDKNKFERFLTKFNDLARYLYQFPKPVIAAINGHAVAGGCILTLTADYRIATDQPSKFALNEITFGSSIFASSVTMLRATVGQRNAERILLSGTMYNQDEALKIGLIDQVCPANNLLETAIEKATELPGPNPEAFASLKNLLRAPLGNLMRDYDPASIEEFIEIWYSPDTWKRVEQIQIRS